MGLHESVVEEVEFEPLPLLVQVEDEEGEHEVVATSEESEAADPAPQRIGSVEEEWAIQWKKYFTKRRAWRRLKEFRARRRARIWSGGCFGFSGRREM